MVYPQRTGSTGLKIRSWRGQSFVRSTREAVLTGTHTTATECAIGEREGTLDPGQPVIEIDHVTKRSDDYVAVADVDFTIASGEFFSILGP